MILDRSLFLYQIMFKGQYVRMKIIVYLVMAIAAVGMNAACAGNPMPQSREPDHVTQLKWLDTADADKMFQADVKNGAYQFYVACGLSCEPVGVGGVDAIQCYPVAKLHRMAGTADALESDEDAIYQQKAITFVIRYNVQMAEYLSKHGLTDCVAGESWPGAMDEMNKRLKEQDVTGDSVDIAYSKDTNKFRFAAHLSPANYNASIETQLCSIALEYHLSGKVIVEIYDRNDSAPPSSIECRYGQVLPSDWKPTPSDYPYDSFNE